MATYFGTGLVWDKDRECILCRFVNNMFCTTDEYTKEKLDSLGYIADRDDEIVIIEDDPVEYTDSVALAELDIDELKAICKENGYRGYGNIQDVNKLIEFIQIREGD